MKEKLKEILAVQSKSGNQWRMFAYIIRQLSKTNCEYYTFNGCIYVTKGAADLYPCVVAHMDTVHNIVENLSIIEIEDNLIGYNACRMEQTGIGGDDIVGVFIALQCLETFDDIKLVFFRDEEIGCEGSYDSDKDFFEDCSFILQCDRQRNKDFVNNIGGMPLSSDEFQKDVLPIIEKYGYSFTEGMMTDVMALKEERILPSMANISCGYYRPHQDDEYVNVTDVFKCLGMVKEIIYSMGNTSYPCPYTKVFVQKYSNYSNKPFKYSNKWENESWNGYEYEEEYNKNEWKEQTCDCCLEKTNVVEWVPEFNEFLCDKCIEEYSEMLTTY